jgi:hypothetical protein
LAGTVRHADLSSRTARRKLRAGRQAHWRAIEPGRTHLGYQRRAGDKTGRWIFRRYVGAGQYEVTGLARADDVEPANGTTILDFVQAEAAARRLVDTPAAPNPRLTVAHVLADYVEHQRHRGKPVADLIGRGRVHVLPYLGSLPVAQLTADRLRKWLHGMAEAAPQKRPKNGRPQFRPAPVNKEDHRRRRASANRNRTVLLAALNLAYREGKVSNADAWRRTEPFAGVTKAQPRYLQNDQARRPNSAGWSCPISAKTAQRYRSPRARAASRAMCI